VSDVLAERFALGAVQELEHVAWGAVGAVWTLLTDVGVPSPESIATADGDYVLEHDGGWWRLYGWVDGEVPYRRDVNATSWLADGWAASIRSTGEAQLPTLCPSTTRSTSTGPRSRTRLNPPKSPRRRLCADL
jgi:hypothetical protein